MYLPVDAASPPETASDPGTRVSPSGTDVMAWYRPALVTVNPEFDAGMSAMVGAETVVMVDPWTAELGAMMPAPASNTTDTCRPEADSCSPM